MPTVGQIGFSFGLMYGVLVFAALASSVWTDPINECKGDRTKYAAQDSCTKFFECYDNKIEENECPKGTFFDKTKLHCRSPWDAECNFTAEKAKLQLAGKRPKVYLGFDDGPGHGTRDVLNTLRDNQVEATFFINGVHMSPNHGFVYAALNRETLLRIVTEGHDIGDHSFNHMKHNNRLGEGNNAYQDLKADLRAFGSTHTDFVKSELITAKLDERTAEKVTQQMREIVRLPFTNAWRVNMADGSDSIVADCEECTKPLASGKISTEIAEELHNGRDKANIYGWDLEWELDFVRDIPNMTTEKAAQIMLSSLEDGTNTKKEGKIVVLAHDQEFGADLKGGNVDMAVALDRFIKIAKEAGFVFRKLATYPYDD